MLLTINDLGKKFKLEMVAMTQKDCVIQSDELMEYITSLSTPVIEEPPAPPPAPEKVIYEPAPDLKYPIESYETQGWTQQNLIDAGHLVPKVIVESIPPAPDKKPEVKAPAPPATKSDPPETDDAEFIIDGVIYVMAEKASGATRQDFVAQGWEDKDLIDQEYFVAKSAPAPAEPKWPAKNENEEWIDFEGTIFDKERHGWTKANIPGVTVKGVFTKKRGYKEPATPPPASQAEADMAPPPPKKEAPPASGINASSASEAPKAPAAPSTEDETLSAELASIVKDWS